MAERRSFSIHVVESDDFYNLSLPAQALYFHLGLRAKDKGICNGVFTLSKVLGCNCTVVHELCTKGFIKPIPDSEFGEWEIVHWYENNGIGETAKKRNNYKYRQWRKDVINRDKECRVCGTTDNLQAHHIRSFSEFPLLRFCIENGITLCERCHKELHRKEKENGRC